MTERWIDFRGTPPSVNTLKRNGISGVLRYIGLGSEGKQITAAEYRAYAAGGIEVLLVAELGTGDAWAAADDFATGQARARLALADARATGIPDSVGIACAADAHASSAAQITDAVAYARGFASVLSKARTGFYGFSETSRAVHAAGVVGWHWWCGAPPMVREEDWVAFWQRNVAPTTLLLDGTQCDINERLGGPIPGATKEDDMQLTDKWDEDAIGARPGTVGHAFLNTKQNAAASRALAAANQATVKTLVDLLSKQTGQSADEIGAAVKAAVAEALQENVVHVDIDVASNQAGANA